MDEAASGRQVLRTASLLTFIALASKPVNFFKDIVVAALFGTTAAKDAYLVAFALPDLISSLAIEGLSAILVPIFTEYAAKGEEDRAWRVASTIANAIIVLLSLATVIVIVAAPILVTLLAPAFPRTTHDLAVRLARLMAVSMIFMGLQGLMAGILNAHQRFVAPALVPVAFNAAMVMVVLALHTRGIESLALATVAGTACMVLIQVPRLPWGRLCYRAKIDLRDEGARRFARLAGPLILGTLILSSTGIINRIFASFLPAGSLAALDFALRTTGIAYVVAPALSTVLLPTLSRQASLGQWADFRARLTLGVKMLLLVNMPVTAGLILLSQPIVRLLFQRGAFDQHSTAITAAALAWYSLGLVSYGLYYLLINTFYALQNTVIRIQAGLLLVTTYIVGNVLLIGILGAKGIALSYGLAHSVACVFLLVRLGRTLSWHVERAVATFAGRVGGATVMMSIVLALMQLAVGPQTWQGRFVEVAVMVLLMGGAAVIVYVIGLWLLRVEEVRRLRDFV